MASITKTYIDGKDYTLYRKWWIGNYEKMKKELGSYIWLCTFSVFYPNEPEEFTPEFLLKNTQDLKKYKDMDDFAIWNTSEKVDKWLVKNCKIKSFRNRILEVYPKSWSGFKGQKWALKHKIGDYKKA